MAKNYLQPGERVPVILGSSETATAGEILIQGSIVGVAQETGAEGDTIMVHRTGVHLVTKKTGTAWTQGDPLYWDSSPGELTKTAADGTFAGFAFADATSAAATGEILLIPNVPDAASGTYELKAEKNASSGYAGLTSTFQLQLKNLLGTFTSLLQNAATAIRTWALPDFSGDIVVASAGAAKGSKVLTATLSSGTVTVTDALCTTGALIIVGFGTKGGTKGGTLEVIPGSGSYVINCLKDTDLTTETGCNSVVYIHIFYA